MHRPSERLIGALLCGAVVTLQFRERAHGWEVEAVHAQPTWVDDAYAVAIAEPDAGGVLGASTQRTLAPRRAADPSPRAAAGTARSLPALIRPRPAPPIP